MKKFTKCVVAVFALALFGALLVGCGGSGSSAAASKSAATTDDLFAEMQASVANENYKSVTMDMTGTIDIDYSAMLADDSSSSSASASSESASSASASSSTTMSIPLTINAKCDLSGEKEKMYIDMDMMGQNFEIYTNGSDAVIVMYGQAISATLDELGMSEYGSIGSIMKSQGGDVANAKDAVTSIEKTTEGTDTTYKMKLDPAKVNAADASGTLSQLGGTDMISDYEIDITVNKDGLVTAMDISMTGKGFSSVINTKLYDYDNTVVPEAPEATVKYSDLTSMTTNS